MGSKKLVCLVVVMWVALTAYEPELMLTTHPQFINKAINSNSQLISDKINSFPIPNPPLIQEKVAGVKVTVNMTNIKQHVDIHWGTNILQVIDMHTIKINSKNINISVTANVEAKIGLLKKQKGPLKINIQKLQTDVWLVMDHPKCPKSIGFDLQIKDVFVNADKVDIKFEGHNFDNTIISLIERFIKPRVPALLKKAIQEQINPLLSNKTCTRIEEEIQIGDKYYVAIVNTSQVPSFDQRLKYFQVPIDLTLQNMVTNETNNQLERDDLPSNPDFSYKYDVSIAVSSNFMNTLIWLVGDAELLHLTVNNSMLGDNPPILLNTTNLSILLPGLKSKWPNKEVFLMISPSTRYEHLLVHSGRIVTVVSLSIKFVVNVTQNVTDVNQCLKQKACIVGCDLNMTLPLSLALKMNYSTIVGMIHSASFYEVIDAAVNVNVDSFESIVNSIVGSMIPSINSQLVGGMDVPEAIRNITDQYKITDFKFQSFLDYAALGLTLDL